MINGRTEPQRAQRSQSRGRAWTPAPLESAALPCSSSSYLLTPNSSAGFGPPPSVSSVISVATGNNSTSMITDHGSRINNKEVPKILISDHCSLIIERHQPRRAAGFTLIEILVVLSIIVLLIAILVPAAILAERYAYSSATQGDLAGLSQALSVYHTDFSMYPDSDLCYSGQLYTTAPTSVKIPQYAAYDYLAQCLTGYLPGEEDGYPSDSTLGANGYSGGTLSQCAGFTMQPYKKVYGPYMPVNAQNIIPDGAATGNYYFSGDFPPTTGAPLPILYFSATTSPSGTTVFDTTPGAGVFCIGDNSTTTTQSVGVPAVGGVPKVGTPLAPSSSPTSANAADYQQYLFLQLVGDKTGMNNVSGGTITGRDSYLLVAPGLSQLYFTGDNLVYGGQ